VTAFGLFLTPVFYVLMRRLAGNRPLVQHGEVHVPVVASAPAHGAGGGSIQPLPAAPRHPIE
jgi:multidrug efflux pump